MLDRLTSIKGAQFSLGPELGRGGEGIVYGVSGRPDLAVKVYKKGQVTNERRTKLRQMVAMASPQLAKHSAWPIDVVDNGVFAVVMPRVNGIEIHDLYGPKSRMIKMPKATFRFLIMSAYNLCAALHEIHQVGAVVGDFNQRNILIGEDGGVCFVDCDSFQIKFGQHLFKCTVGTPDQLAPELHGADLSTILRSPNHDNFTLAVLIFQLLFIGRHPFAGVGGPDEISEAIRRYLFAYGKRAPANGIRPPPHVPPADTVPQGLFALFERAFADNSAKAMRPLPTEWAQQLKTFLNSIIKCRVNPVHEYVSSRATCPWCELRVVLFSADAQQPFAIDAATINELADKLEAARPYTYNFSLPPVGVIVAAPLPADLDQRSGAFWFGILLAALALVGLFHGYWFLAMLVGFWALSLIANGKRRSRRAEHRKKLEENCTAAEKRQKAIEGNLRTIHGRYVQDFETARRRVTPLKTEYNGLPARRQKQIGELHQRLRELQLEQYLDGQFISGAGIPGIGPKRLATLQGFGVETAADISWQMRAPGIGADLKGKLLAWRQSCERGFRFNPNAQIDPREIHKIDAGLYIRRNEIEAEIHSIHELLDVRTRQLRADLEVAVMELPAAAQAVAQAKADLAWLNNPTQVPVVRAGTDQSNVVGIGLVIGLIVAAIIGIAFLSNQPATTVAHPTIIKQSPPIALPTIGIILLRSNVDTRVIIDRLDTATPVRPIEVALTSESTKSPALQDLTAGRYRFTFTAEGWKRSKSLEVDVVAGQRTPVNVTFDRVDVEFTSTPSGAEVKDGSVHLGTTPFRASGLSAEEHVFAFLQRGRPEGAVTTTVGETSGTVHYSWPVGNLVVTSSPSGAEVWDMGSKLGTTPLNLPQVFVGEYQFAIVADGFARSDVQGTVKTNETLSLDAALTDIRPAKIKIHVAGDGKRLRIVNVGNRLVELKRILVRGAGEVIVEDIASDARLNPNESVDVTSNSTLTSQMTVSLEAEPKTIEATCEWEPPPKLPPPSPFSAKSIKANLDLLREELVIANQSTAQIRIRYILIVRVGVKSPIRVNVDRDVAPKRSIRIALRTRIDSGDSVQIATEPALPSGTIEFSSL